MRRFTFKVHTLYGRVRLRVYVERAHRRVSNEWVGRTNSGLQYVAEVERRNIRTIIIEARRRR